MMGSERGSKPVRSGGLFVVTPRRQVGAVAGVRRPTWILACLCAAVAAPLVGCGGKAEVSGVVTLDGRPLGTGVVTFTPAVGGPTGYAAIGPEGRYEVQVGANRGLPAGAYIVTVAANAAPVEGSVPGPGPDADGITPLVTPPRYADRETSPLKVVLRSGTQDLPLHLTAE